MVQKHRPSPSDINETIKEGYELQKVLEMPGWKHIDRWLDRQVEGGQKHFETESQVLNAWSLIKFFNMFLRYLMFLHERRAYNKLKTYIIVTIKNGQAYANRRAKEQAKQQ